jgi:bis(5'-adenosyl)-triphosphatase
VLKVKYNCDAFNVAVQDGTHAGQSVPHVHVHVLPRHRGDLERNDDIYDELEAWAPRDEKKSMKIPKFDVPEDSERRDRTLKEMAAESAMYKSLI